MKRLFFSTVTVFASVWVLASGAIAAQVAPGDARADLNGDRTVSLHEVVTYNRDQRNKR